MPSFPPQQLEITRERLIVGEGDGDTAFFNYLCRTRGIDGFDIRNAKGNTDFNRFLKAVQAVAGDKLKSIVLVADSDETPEASFQNVKRQIPNNWAHPNNPLTKAKRAGTPHLVVVMLPFPRIGASSHGCLESMLLQAAESHLAAQTVCLTDYCDCIGTGNWSLTHRDKMRLRCLLSASCQADPNIALQHALNPERQLIPLGHSYFNEFEELLRNFDAWMASNHAAWDDWKASVTPRAG